MDMSIVLYKVELRELYDAQSRQTTAHRTPLHPAPLARQRLDWKGVQRTLKEQLVHGPQRDTRKKERFG